MWWCFPLCLFLFHTLVSETFSSLQRRSNHTPDYYKAFKSREDHGNLTRVILHNSLTVLIEEEPGYPLAAIVTYVRRLGLASEQPLMGRARLLEKIYFETGEPALQMRSLGGKFKVVSKQGRPCYQSIVPAENVLKALAIQAHVLQQRSPEPHRMRVGLKLLSEQIRQLGLNPFDRAREHLLNWVYPRQAIEVNWLSKGSETEEKSPLLDQELKAFSDFSHRPHNIILAIAGAVRRERVLEKVAELHGSTRSSSSASRRFPKQKILGPKPSFRYRHLREELKQTQVWFAYPVPGIEHQDYLPLMLISYILAEGRGSLLQQYLVEENRSALEVFSCLQILDPGGVFLIAVIPDPERVDRAEVGILAQLAALRLQGIPKSQLNRAKALFIKDVYLRMQFLDERAHGLAFHEDLGSYRDRNRLPQQIHEIGAGEVSRVFRRYFNNNNLSLSEHFPKHADPRQFTNETFLQTMKLLVPPATEAREAQMAGLETAEQKSDLRPVQFKANPLKQDLMKTSILRGPNIYLKEDHSVPLVHLSLSFPGGRVNESSQNAGITELMVRSLLRQVGSGRSTVRWSDLEQQGADIEVLNDFDSFGLQATVLSPHLEKLLYTLIQALRNPVIEKTIFEMEQSRLLGQLRQDAENFFELSIRRATRVLFPDHPYGLPRYGTSQSVKDLQLASVRAWAASQLKGVHPLIVVRGDIHGTSFLENLTSILSDARLQHREPIHKDVRQRAKSLFSADERDNGSREGTVIVAALGPSITTPEEWMLEVLEGIVAGPGGKLSVLLRDQEQAAYEVDLFHHAGLSGGIILATGSVLPDSQQKARDALLKGLSELKAISLTKEEFMQGLVSAITRFYIHQQDGRGYVKRLARILLAREALGYEKDYLSTIRSMERKDLEFVAEKFFSVSD